jgi:diguanylate cyclase (GGDEF)-like protein
MEFSKFRTNVDQLYFSEKNSYAWIEHSPVCTKIVDLDFNLQYMSSAGVGAHAMDNIIEYYNKPYPFDFYPQPFRDEMCSNLRKVLDTGDIIEQERAVLDINGNEIWFHSTITRIHAKNNKIDHLMVVSIDTTAQHIATKKLEHLNDNLEAQIHERTLELECLNKQLHLQTETDFLTRLPNRRSLDRRLEENIATAKRSHQFLALLMLDVDHFKRYNDKYGHSTGDMVLQKIAKTINSSLSRKTDIAARYGGEEFVVILPNTDLGAGLVIAEKIRSNVESLSLHRDAVEAIHSATVSIGVASFKGVELNTAKLFIGADKALFSAKQSGRNNCQTFYADACSIS